MKLDLHQQVQGWRWLASSRLLTPAVERDSEPHMQAMQPRCSSTDTYLPRRRAAPKGETFPPLWTAWAQVESHRCCCREPYMRTSLGRAEGIREELGCICCSPCQPWQDHFTASRARLRAVSRRAWAHTASQWARQGRAAPLTVCVLRGSERPRSYGVFPNCVLPSDRELSF